MTLDVIIGRLKINWDESNQRAYEDEEIVSLNLNSVADVEPCPESEKNICDPNNTIYPKRSIRSGSTGFWRFWRVVDKLDKIYKMMRVHPGSNDTDIALLKPVNHQIQELKTKDINKEKVKKYAAEDKERDKKLIQDVYGIEDIEEETNKRIVGHKSRLKWLKYWSDKAVNLYREKAAIKFS